MVYELSLGLPVTTDAVVVVVVVVVDSADRGATERECYEVKCSVFAQEFVVDAYDKKKTKKNLR